MCHLANAMISSPSTTLSNLALGSDSRDRRCADCVREVMDGVMPCGQIAALMGTRWKAERWIEVRVGREVGDVIGRICRDIVVSIDWFWSGLESSACLICPYDGIPGMLQ